jgi:uncharacterized protein YdaU (DUF1376 family)
MHYFQHNIADYRKDTMHLTLLEHGCYRQLLDQYYLSEEPLPLDEEKLMRLICARNEEDKNAIKLVLQDFFTQTEDGYVHRRCAIEIKAYQERLVNSSKGGKASAAAKATRSSKAQVDVNQSSSDGQPTINHKHNNQYIGKSNRFEEFWSTWPSSERKNSKAVCKSKWEDKGLDEIADKIITHVGKLKVSDQWVRGFEPAPATYLNQKRYLDEESNSNQNGLPPNLLRKPLRG